MPLGLVYTGEKDNLLANQKKALASNFCEPNFKEFRLKWWRKELFCIVWTSWMGWGRVEWHWHMGMSYLTSLNPELLKNIAYVGFSSIFLLNFFLHVFCSSTKIIGNSSSLFHLWRRYFLYQILTIVQSMLFPHVSDYCRRLFVGGGNVHVDDR